MIELLVTILVILTLFAFGFSDNDEPDGLA